MTRLAATLFVLMLVASGGPGAQSAEEKKMKARRFGLRTSSQHVVNQARDLEICVGPGDGPFEQFLFALQPQTIKWGIR